MSLKLVTHYCLGDQCLICAVEKCNVDGFITFTLPETKDIKFNQS